MKCKDCKYWEPIDFLSGGDCQKIEDDYFSKKHPDNVVVFNVDDEKKHDSAGLHWPRIWLYSF